MDLGSDRQRLEEILRLRSGRMCHSLITAQLRKLHSRPKKLLTTYNTYYFHSCWHRQTVVDAQRPENPQAAHSTLGCIRRKHNNPTRINIDTMTNEHARTTAAMPASPARPRRVKLIPHRSSVRFSAVDLVLAPTSSE